MRNKYSKLVMSVLLLVSFGLPFLHGGGHVHATVSSLASIPGSLTPAVSPPASEGTNPVPEEMETTILLYHYIEPLSPANSTDKLRANYITTPETLEKHLKYLRDNNYVSIDLYQLYDSLNNGTELPEKTVVITFDDGDVSVYTYAFPLMNRYGFTGTIFMITQFTEENRKGFLTWDQALEMARAGWRLEPHTKTHPSLRGNSREYQREQINGSIQSLKERLGYMPRFFAYPYGEYDATSIAVACEVGLWGAVTTNPDDSNSRLSIYELPRDELFHTTTMQSFKNYLDDHKENHM